jgi:hypothetical protein
MTEVMIKVRLFTWFRNEESAVDPSQQQRVEKISHMGEVVDIDDDASFQRGEELGAFFTDKEREAVEDGTYIGPGSEAVYAARGEAPSPTPLIEDAEGEGGSAAEMSAEDLADYIKRNRLNVEDTVALAGDDTESIEKVLDAENIATDNDPRKGVEAALEAKLAAAATG